MTSLNFQEPQLVSNFAKDMLQSPQGWITTGIHIINLNAGGNRNSGNDRNLSLAAKRTEQLIDALCEGLSMDVPVSYMRVENGNVFHILLLISSYDFHSPKILAARILAEKFARTEEYDIRFVFAIESENRMYSNMKFGGYKLLHKCATADREQKH